MQILGAKNIIIGSRVFYTDWVNEVYALPEKNGEFLTFVTV